MDAACGLRYTCGSISHHLLSGAILQEGFGTIFYRAACIWLLLLTLTYFLVLLDI